MPRCRTAHTARRGLPYSPPSLSWSLFPIMPTASHNSQPNEVSRINEAAPKEQGFVNGEDLQINGASTCKVRRGRGPRHNETLSPSPSESYRCRPLSDLVSGRSRLIGARDLVVVSGRQVCVCRARQGRRRSTCTDCCVTHSDQ